jgi:rSAM/selenodomain-associated transferase 2
MKISIIIPTLNEAGHIRECLERLQSFRARGHEVIVADGGSEDHTLDSVNGLADIRITAPRGRALQMNAGARQAGGDVFVFLHADTWLPENADQILVSRLENLNHCWGRFDIRLSGHNPLFRIIERFMNIRTRLTGINTGDHAIFISRDLFNDIGGFKEIPLMEDIELSKRLKKIVQPVCLPQKVISSSRRWEGGGIIRTILMMWLLRLRYYLGSSPEKLVAYYEGR